MAPLVSIILPVFNGEKFIRQAVDSILNQTYKNLEFIIINDFSTDSTLEILNTYSDSRIRIVNNSHNQKIAKSLNKGIVLARGKYIARMDGDDIAHPRRLEKQVSYMENNPETIVLGTSHKSIGFSTRKKIRFSNPEENKLRLIFHTCCTHPSIICRKEQIELNCIKYNDTLVPSEDYDFIYQCSKAGEINNLKEVLLQYRTFKPKISQHKYSDKRDTTGKEIRKQILTDQDIQFTEEELELHCKLCQRKVINSKQDLDAVLSWSNKLSAFLYKHFNRDLVVKEFQLQWIPFLIKNKSLNVMSWYFKNSSHPFLKPGYPLLSEAFKILLK